MSAVLPTPGSMGAGPTPRGPTPNGAGPLPVKARRRMNPSRLCQGLVAVVVRELPPEHRTRYALEFYSEMYGMSRAGQLGYAVGVLVHAWSLAAALEGGHPAEQTEKARTDWRCRLHRHRYVRRNNPDAETVVAAFYRQCIRCGVIDDQYLNAAVKSTALPPF